MADFSIVRTDEDKKNELHKAIDSTINATEGNGIFDFYPHRSDTGNAERLAYYERDNMRYCAPWGRWYINTGPRWEVDNRNLPRQKVKKVIRKLYGELTFITDDVRRASIAEFLAKSESAHAIRACLQLAEGELPAVPEQFDTDPWKLNIENGTLDLKTGELKEHEPKDYITKIAPVSYDAKATCPQWLEFLNTIFKSNVALIKFIQKAIGYSLTGLTVEQCLFIFFGSGANGKSTFDNTIRTLLGDYAQKTPMETFLVKRSDSISNDIARLQGSRFLSATEVEQGRRLAESLIKQLTGQDTVTARFLHAEFFEFVPAFKLFLSTNHKPIIRGTDHAIWRRIRLVPFEVTIPSDQQDIDLPHKLESELPGILNWALEGCKLWQSEGLGMPEKIREAGLGYQVEMDSLASFFADRCVIEPRKLVKSSVLYSEYKRWAEQEGEEIISNRKFTARIIERGFDSTRQSSGQFFLGIGVLE